MGDPFPNTENQTLEQRLAVLFRTMSTITVLTDDPKFPQTQQAWLNSTTGQLCIYDGQRIWRIQMT